MKFWTSVCTHNYLEWPRQERTFFRVLVYAREQGTVASVFTPYRFYSIFCIAQCNCVEITPSNVFCDCYMIDILQFGGWPSPFLSSLQASESMVSISHLLTMFLAAFPLPQSSSRFACLSESTPCSSISFQLILCIIASHALTSLWVNMHDMAKHVLPWLYWWWHDVWPGIYGCISYN